jgi:hypothetical protein
VPLLLLLKQAVNQLHANLQKGSGIKNSGGRDRDFDLLGGKNGSSIAEAYI